MKIKKKKKKKTVAVQQNYLKMVYLMINLYKCIKALNKEEFKKAIHKIQRNIKRYLEQYLMIAISHKNK